MGETKANKGKSIGEQKETDNFVDRCTDCADGADPSEQFIGHQDRNEIADMTQNEILDFQAGFLSILVLFVTIIPDAFSNMDLPDWISGVVVIIFVIFSQTSLFKTFILYVKKIEKSPGVFNAFSFFAVIYYCIDKFSGNTPFVRSLVASIIISFLIWIVGYVFGYEPFSHKACKKRPE